MTDAKPFTIPKRLVCDAFLDVKANAGAAGIDGETIHAFERRLENNLYEIGNRMSSGTYFPPPVKAVPIPKKSGGTRMLGVPTVADRVAQMVVKMVLEPELEPHFLPDSYGYRPGKSALDAVGVTRQRCWKKAWILEFDIKGLFDNIPHELIIKALEKHTENRWVKLYIGRWLKAPMQCEDGTLVERNKGTPQGGVISPLLANLFMHYTFDRWLSKRVPHVPWCRYADDGLVHCDTEKQAKAIMAALAQRFAECGIEMHPEKTRIVYCKQTGRKQDCQNVKFTFLGYDFQPRQAINKKGQGFTSFLPAVSREALKSMRQHLRKSNVRNRTELSIEDIARQWNPVLRGWINYYGRFYPSAMHGIYGSFNMMLLRWAQAKYKRLRGKTRAAAKHIEREAKCKPRLFAHWTPGMVLPFSLMGAV
jgi:RNA-directed DNA polymerase